MRGVDERMGGGRKMQAGIKTRRLGLFKWKSPKCMQYIEISACQFWGKAKSKGLAFFTRGPSIGYGCGWFGEMVDRGGETQPAVAGRGATP